MKKLLLLVTSLLIFQKAHFQNTNDASHYAIDATGGMISINSKSYYISNIKASCCYDKIFVVGVNANGQTFFSKELTFTGADYLTKIIKTVDDHIVVLGRTQPACDVGGVKDFIARIDTNGTQIFKTVITGFNGITDITALPDSSVLMAANSLLIRYSKTGQYLSDISPGLTNINCALSLANGNILINGMLNNVLTNMEYDLSGFSMVTQQNANYAVSKFSQMPNGRIIGLSQAGEILSYNPTLSYISSAPGLNLTATDFVTRNDSVFASGINALNQSPFYEFLDMNFNVLYLTQSNYKNVRPTGMNLTNKNKINIITKGSSSLSTIVTFNGMFHLGISGNFYSSPDVGVVNVSVLNSKLQNMSGSYLLSAELTATIKNFGADTVKSLYLNHYMPGFQLCANLFHKLYEITIPPGATVSVQTGTFNIHPYLSNPQPSGSTSAKVEMCLFTTVPNFKNDIEVDNDAYCDSVLFTVTGITETELLSESINVFPIPFSESINISSENTIKAIKFFSSVGVLLKEEVCNAKEIRISQEDLTAGIYLMHIETEKGVLVKKIIKN